MRRFLSGPLALMLVVSIVGFQDTEGGWRRRARRQCCPCVPRCCAPAPTVSCAATTIECPYSFTGITSSGGKTLYNYTGSRCSCNATCVASIMPITLTYSTKLGNTDPKLSCSSFTCDGTGNWTDSDPNNWCIKTAGAMLTARPDHIGEVGIDKFADGAKFQAEAPYTSEQIDGLVFQKGGAVRQAIVFVVKNAAGTPVQAIGYELQAAGAGAGLRTTKVYPHAYDATLPAKNAQGQTVDVILRIYTKN